MNVVAVWHNDCQARVVLQVNSSSPTRARVDFHSRFSCVQVVIAGLSNVYTHYITTPEEYQAQRYEGGSTLYGPNTFTAYLQHYTALVSAMVNGEQGKSVRFLCYLSGTEVKVTT